MTYFVSLGSLIYFLNSRLSVILHIIALFSRVLVEKLEEQLKSTDGIFCSFVETLFFKPLTRKTI